MAESLLSKCMESGLEATITQLSLKAPKELQEGIFALSSFATAEFLQLIGIGSGFTSMDLQGFALAQINKKLDEIQAKVNTMMETPAKTALTYLQRGIESVKAKNNLLAFDELKKVIEYAIQARNYQKKDLEAVVNLSLYSIFADLMINTYDAKKDFFTPYELLEPDGKEAIKNKIKHHLDTLLEAQNEQKSSLFSLPSTKREKKEANQNLVDSVLKKSLQYLCPPGSPVPVKFIPDGEEDAVYLNLDGKPGKVDASTVFIYKEGSNVVIHHYNKQLEANIDCGHREELLLKANNSGLTIDNSTKEVKSSEFTDLIHASSAGNSEVVAFMLQHPGDQVNQRDQNGRTPLHLAAEEGHLDVVSVLLKHPGVQVNQRDQGGRTPLHLAAWKGHLDVTRKLLSAGADPSPVDNYKSTPLHFAAVYGHLDVTRKLLSAGADISAVNNNGKWTPLHAAALRGHLHVTRALVAAGADIKAVDRDGETPAQAAKVYRHMNVFNYLQSL